MNMIVMAVSALSFAFIGEELAVREFLLLHGAYTVPQLEIACICFGISAFIRRSGVGAGLGLAALLYFLNLFKNISSQAEFLKYITPFAYAEAADIISESAVICTCWPSVSFMRPSALVQPFSNIQEKILPRDILKGICSTEHIPLHNMLLYNPEADNKNPCCNLRCCHQSKNDKQPKFLPVYLRPNNCLQSNVHIPHRSSNNPEHYTYNLLHYQISHL